MTTTTDPDNDIPLKPGSIHTIAKRIEARSRLLAQELHELAYIYALYGALDGFSLFFSMLRWGFSLYLSLLHSTLPLADALRTWMLTPEGLAITLTGAIGVTAFSLLGNYFNEKDQNQFKRYAAILWVYLRDVLKGFKNAVRAISVAISLWGTPDLNYLKLPAGFACGGLFVIHRLFTRRVQSLCKVMMDENKSLLERIQARPCLSAEESADFLLKVRKQSLAIKGGAFFSAVFGAMVDSLYYQWGVLGLCSLSGPALLAMTICCAIYSISCFMSRLYEIDELHRKLSITQVKVDIALYTKEHSISLQLAFTELQGISIELAKKELSEARKGELEKRQDTLAKEIKEKIEELTKMRARLQSLTALSNFRAFLLGLGNGLAAYCVLTTVTFAISAILTLSSTLFPPILLIASVSSGIPLLMGFAAHSMIRNREHLKKQGHKSPQPFERLIDLLKVFKNKKLLKDNIRINPLEKPTVNNVQKIIKEDLIVDYSPPLFVQQWLEVLRSLASGAKQGITLGALLVPVTFIVAAVSSIAYALILALRAYAKGFGSAQVKPPTTEKSEKVRREEQLIINPDNPPIDTQILTATSSFRTPSPSSISNAFSFFNYKKPDLLCPPLSTYSPSEVFYV